MNPGQDFPILTMFDMEAAFPSVAHIFLFLTLLKVGLPLGVLNIFKGIYDNVRAIGFSNEGEAIFLFYVLSGVLQGCPLAGSAYAIVADPS